MLDVCGNQVILVRWSPLMIDGSSHWSALGPERVRRYPGASPKTRPPWRELS